MAQSPTEFSYVFKNHEPRHVLEAFMTSAEELHQKGTVKFKWLECDQSSLTFHFRTKMRVKHVTWNGYYGQGVLTPTESGGTKFYLHLESSAYQWGSFFESVFEIIGIDLGAKQGIWAAIIGELKLHFRASSAPKEKLESQIDEDPVEVDQPITEDTNSPNKPFTETTTPFTEAESTRTSPQPTKTIKSTSAEPVASETSKLPIAERLDLIDRLIDLRQSGYLSEAEFSEQKNQLIYRP